ncbi:MAG TPA: radical SAM protein [Blastocatellia bacterium]|jgi:radical SAM enzyme (TIGR01210 family)|nr:radical SAM protein [Blastocatellia bacterium]
MVSSYPERIKERDRWILARRKDVARATPSARNDLDPYRPYAFLVEDERSESGEIVQVATLFLTNRECPWRCLMCDLWRDTLAETVPVGAIPAQIDYALARLGPARQIKLYNNGSFFDRQAIPFADYEAVAARLRGFERVIVECHPALVGDDCLRFRDLLDGRLEVAMGLETVHPTVGPRLNKGVSLDRFAFAAERLRENGVALRVFILVKPPFLDEDEALYWACRSLDFAFDRGATVAALIPTRGGNGALEALAKLGDFSPPKLATLEAATAYGVGLGRGRVFGDLWDLERFSNCPDCFSARALRLREMNIRQEVPSRVACRICGEKSE